MGTRVSWQHSEPSGPTTVSLLTSAAARSPNLPHFLTKYLHDQEIRTDPNTFYFSLAGSRPERPSEEELLARASGSGRARWFYRISPRPLSAETASKGVVTKLIYWVLRQLHVRQVG